MNNNSFWHHVWQPKPVDQPTVDPSFHQMDPLTRATESWRYVLLSMEHWLSGGGWLREWIRQVLRLALILAAPAFLVVPLVTLLLASLLKWTVLIASIAWKVVVVVVLFLVAAVITAFNWLMFKAFLSSRR